MRNKDCPDCDIEIDGVWYPTFKCSMCGGLGEDEGEEDGLCSNCWGQGICICCRCEGTGIDPYSQKNPHESYCEWCNRVIREHPDGIKDICLSCHQEMLDSIRGNPIEYSEERLIGYKVMNTDGDYIWSMANRRMRFPLELGTVLRMPRPGVFLSVNKAFVEDYYLGHNDIDAFLILEFDPNKITSGNLTDRESEVTVPEATIIGWEIYESEE